MNRFLNISVLALFVGVGCGSAAPKVSRAVEPVVEKPAATTQKPNAAVPTPEDEEYNARIAAMLERVAKARGLPIKRRVPGLVLNRDEILRRVRAQVEHDMPREAMVGQGELLAALELVPADYDFVSGTFALLGGRIAGFYDPKDGTMVLAEDLDDAEAEETLAHELAHALADQSFPLAPMIDYKPGDGDRLSAVHSFIEGDATSAMLDVTLGSAFKMPEDAVRLAFIASTQLSEIGGRTPRLINASLVSPYTDGFSIIQALRRRGDWQAVDSVWRMMPDTTEQLLHIEKLLAREPALPVSAPTLGVFEKRGFSTILSDVFGEQSFRLMFEDFSSRDRAREAAAGWGGDRFVVGERKEGEKGQYVFALSLRMDTEEDAKEASFLFAKKYGKACKERAAQGPVVWQLRGRDIALVAGPYERAGGSTRSIGSCLESEAWLAEVWQGVKP